MKNKAAAILMFTMMLVSCVTNEEESIDVKSIEFEKEKIEIENTQSAAAVLKINPMNADFDESKMSYSLLPEDTCEIISYDRNGFIFRGVKKGSCVLTVSYENLKCYLTIDVNDVTVSQFPYIKLLETDVTIEKGRKRTVTANLIGCGKDDVNNFEWESSDDAVVEVQYSGSIAVLTAKKYGVCTVTVKNKACRYSSSMVVAVPEKEGNIFYLTTKDNVINVMKNEPQNFEIEIVGGTENDYAMVRYNVKEGEDIFSVSGSGKSFSVIPKECGSGQIEVMHPDARLKLTITVNVITDRMNDRILCDDLLYFDSIKTQEIKCSLISGQKGNYTYRIEDSEIADVINLNGNFLVTPKKCGRTKLIIQNDLIVSNKEIMLIVDDIFSSKEFQSIKTNQNVIKISEGQKNVSLEMQLLGGNEGDSNSFTWKVEDGSVIDVKTNDGKVVYSRSAQNKDGYIKGTAFIDALKKGHSVIEITHPKSRNSCSVDVFVYEKGMISDDRIEVKGEMLLKAVIGSDGYYNLEGKSIDYSKITIENTEPSVINVRVENGKIKYSAFKTGNVLIKLSSPQFMNDFYFNAVCDTKENIDNKKYIESDVREIKGIKGKTYYFSVKGTDADGKSIEILNTDSSICECSAVSDIVCVNLKNKGKCILRIGCEGYANIISIPVECIDVTSEENPGEMEGERFIKLSMEKSYEYRYGFKNIDDKPYHLSDYIYDDESIKLENIDGGIKITALKEGNGTIRIVNPECFNEITVSYVNYKTEKDKEEKNSIWCDKKEITGKKGEKYVIEIKESKKTEENLRIENSDASIMDVKCEGNFILIQMIKEGRGQLKISRGNSNSIYIEVKINPKDYEQQIDYFILPYMVQAVKNNYFEIDIDRSSSYNKIEDILEWVMPSQIKYTKTLNGIRCRSDETGEYEVWCRCEEYGINRKVNVIIYESNDELRNDVRVFLEKDYYSIKKDEQLDLTASVFAENREDVINAIEWKTENNDGGIQIIPNGMNCTIKGNREGKYNCSIVYGKKEFKFFVQVTDEKNQNYNQFIFERMINVKPNVTKAVNYSIAKDDLKDEDYKGVAAVSESRDIEIKCNGTHIVINASKEGTYMCKLCRHGISDYVFMVRCQDETEEDEDYIFSDVKAVSISINETRMINIYSSYNTDDIIISATDSSMNITKKENGIEVCGIKEGNGSITLKCNDKEYTLYYSVNKDSLQEESNIAVQEIIAVEKGRSVNTFVTCRKTVSYEYDRKKIELTENGNSLTVKGIEKGITEIKVYTSEKNYRMIKVYVYEENMNGEYLINITQRVYKVYKNRIFNISPCINGNDPENIKISCSEKDSLDLKMENGMYRVKVMEEGFYKVTFEYHNDEVTVFIYCYDEGNAESGIKDNDRMQYYITSQLLYSFIKIDDAFTFTANIKDFNGNYKFLDSEYIWKTDSTDVISMNCKYNMCTVRALKKGKAKIYCSNIECTNVLVFEVDTGSEQDMYDRNYSFIKLKKSIFDVEVNERISAEAEFINIAKENQNTLYFIYDESRICNIDFHVSDNKIYMDIEGIKCGNEKIKIKCDGTDFDAEITVIVNPKTGGKTVFLTTEQNYSIIRPGEVELVSVRLKNYEEKNISNFVWEKTEGGEYVTIIGNGEDVQIYGVKEGICTIRVKHIPSQSEITLNVEVSSQIKTLKYITADIKVIETQVSSMMDNITINMIGGEDRDLSTYEYSIDRQDVLSVVTTGNTIYYRGLKEGVANVHVSNKKSGCKNEIDILFIVSETKNEAVMRMDVNTLYMKKNSASKNVNLIFENCGDINEGIIEWFIYSQNARSGDVVSIVSSGKRCVIKPLNEGYATVRAYYQPQNISASVSIYVDENGKIEFSEKNMTVSKNESSFVSMKIPEYLENIYDYITYESLDENICRAFGSGKVCCIEGVEKGSCIVRAMNSLDDSVCEIGINVTDEKENDVNITLRKNTYLLNPRSEEQTMQAYISGKDIDGSEDEKIKWEILSDTTKCLSLYPDTGSDVLLKLNNVSDAASVDYGKVREGEAIIKVSHELCNSYKTIYVKIEEKNNFFTLDKYSTKINVSQNVTLNCSILNAKMEDYDKIEWSIAGYNTDKYGTKVEVAKLLNDRGKTCSIFGMNDGVCTVSAFYLGNIVTCEITVNSERVFKINGSTTVKMFPDVNDENYIDVSYMLRPVNQVPIWSVQNVDKPLDMTLVTVEDLSGMQKIRIKPNGIEGKCKITGFVVGIGQVNINVDIKYNPKLTVKDDNEECIIQMTDGSENKAEYEFTSYPSMYYLKVSRSGKYSEYIDAYVEDTVKDGNVTSGKLVIKAKREIPLNGVTVILQQYSLSDFSESSRIDTAESKKSITVSAYYPESGFSLGFRRGTGGFSFLSESQNAAALYNVNDRFITDSDESTYYKFYDTTNAEPSAIELGDGEQHYFILKTLHENSFMENISVSIERDDRNLVIGDNLEGKMTGRGEEERTEIIDNIDTFSEQSMPKVSSIEQKGDGSYIFDISTGGSGYKYGVNWYVRGKEDVKKNKYLTKSDRYYCSDVNYQKPLFYKDGEYLGSIENIKISTESYKKTEEETITNRYFYFDGNDSHKYIVDYERDKSKSKEFWENIKTGRSRCVATHEQYHYMYDANKHITEEYWETTFNDELPFQRYGVITEDEITENKEALFTDIIKQYDVHFGSSYTSNSNNYYWRGPQEYNVKTVVNDYGKFAIFEIVRDSYNDLVVSSLFLQRYYWDISSRLICEPYKSYIIFRIEDNFTDWNSDGFYWGESDDWGYNDIGTILTFYGNRNYLCNGSDNNGMTDHAVVHDDTMLEDISVTNTAVNDTFDITGESKSYKAFDDKPIFYYDIQKSTAGSNINEEQIEITKNTAERKSTRTIKESIGDVMELTESWNTQIENYYSGCLYNNDTVPDFEYNNMYLVIRWTDFTNQIVTKKIPLKELFYNNYADYYTFENGQIESNSGRINTRITEYDYE